MLIRFRLGPAGSGKTYRCLEEVRRALSARPEGRPLLFIAPKQATYQLERQLLAEPGLAGYTRLRIVSFERVARFIFESLDQPLPEMLDEEGRVMVLRGLLARRRRDLKLFRASARLTGFAQQLSQLLSEMQHDQLTPESLRGIARQVPEGTALAHKLEDLVTLLQDYLDWLEAHKLRDTDGLLTAAAEALRKSGKSAGYGLTSRFEAAGAVGGGARPGARSATQLSLFDAQAPVWIEGLWLDGFAEFSRSELDLLAALMPNCETATLAFCLDRIPGRYPTWLSSWSVIERTFERCRQHLADVPGAEMVTELFSRQPAESRFRESPALRHLEQHWVDPRAYPAGSGAEESQTENPKSDIGRSVRLAVCSDPEAEAELAAREILRHARAGGRYREVAVLVRELEGYHQVLQRVFARYDIPCFIDRRELVAHHPLAELTRNALRTIAFGWQHEDWFAALKTGLVPAADTEVDRLENEALARGCRGSAWQKPLGVAGEPELNRWLAGLQARLVPPFHRLALALALHNYQPTGTQLAEAVRSLWRELEVEARLAAWESREAAPSELSRPVSVHATVWDQMNAWLDNLGLGFPAEAMPLPDWLPILEAGLSNLSVGVIPPALDQVLIGAIDRSRNPDLKLALVLGVNEGVFPARPQAPVLLTEADRLELEKHNVLLGSSSRHQLGRERFFAYIACTRARQRLVVSYALQDLHGALLNPSPFISHLRRLFPTLPIEEIPKRLTWAESEHASDWVAPILAMSSQVAQGATPSLAIPDSVLSLPAIARLLDRLRQFHIPDQQETLAPEWAEQLFGPVLRSSVSRLEQFAACPFKFFVHSGLRGEERKQFELDRREQGTFQHDVLALFHEQLAAEGKRWRDLTPAEARGRVSAIAQGLMTSYREGLLEASEQTRFLARSLSESLQDFVATLVGWMRTQYRFDPVAVELPYGGDASAPAWVIDLGGGHQLELRGRIDRIDLCPRPGGEEAFCVVVDYKSSRRQLDPVLLEHGVQLQLPAYLNVVRRWPDPGDRFGFKRLIPAGVFYVNLNGRSDRGQNRRDALEEPEQARKLACRHTGRFDVRALRQLDSRSEVRKGDQFNYRLTRSGQLYRNSPEAMAPAQFSAMLDSVESNLKEIGQQIYQGRTEVDPFRKGGLVACDYCDYQAICRIDPWTHHYRVLRSEPRLSER